MSKNTKLAEVIFKGERRAVYRNRNELEIEAGEYVLVEADRGHDLGKVLLMGDLVRIKRGKGETRSIVRKANDKDLAQYAKNRDKETDAFAVCREKIVSFGLDMKLVGVEVQFDGSKITFYFTAAQRVDFRELVKDLASVYRTRIELRQIGVRDEAKRIGGYGVCGLRQCCTAWLREFEQITTQMAKDQQLSLNPSKISGNCGRLLCCLRYEEAYYQEVFSKFPPLGSTVEIKKKKGSLHYVNVFECTGLVYYVDGGSEWLPATELMKGHVEDGVHSTGKEA